MSATSLEYSESSAGVRPSPTARRLCAPTSQRRSESTTPRSSTSTRPAAAKARTDGRSSHLRRAVLLGDAGHLALEQIARVAHTSQQPTTQRRHVQELVECRFRAWSGEGQVIRTNASTDNVRRGLEQHGKARHMATSATYRRAASLRMAQQTATDHHPRRRGTAVRTAAWRPS
jgi:hypothetical protein